MRLTRQEEQWPNASAVDTRPLGGVFVAHSQVLTAADVQRALTRMSHEIVERNGGVEDVVLVGLQTGGVPLAAKMAEILRQIEGGDRAGRARSTWPSTATTSACAPCCPRRSPTSPSTWPAGWWCWSTTCSSPGAPSGPPSTRSNDFGRARAIQLAVMVDRGHRELPIRPDFVGKNLPTRREEMVDVGEDGVWIGTLEER